MVTKKKTSASREGDKMGRAAVYGVRKPKIKMQGEGRKMKSELQYRSGVGDKYLSTSQTRQAKNATKAALAAPRMSRNVSNAVRTRNASSVARSTASTATSAATSASRKKKR